jgi:hypothetical protein
LWELPSSLTMADGRLKLFCCLLDGTYPPFPLDAQPHLTVGDLKDAITMKYPRIFNFDALALKVWKVDITFDDNWDVAFKESKARGLGTDLFPVQTLAEIFPEQPDPKHVHIIVGRPTDGKNCLCIPIRTYTEDPLSRYLHVCRCSNSNPRPFSLL